MTIDGYDSPTSSYDALSHSSLYNSPVVTTDFPTLNESSGAAFVMPPQQSPRKRALDDRTIVFLEESKTRSNSFKITKVEKVINNLILSHQMVNALSKAFRGFDNVPEGIWSRAAEELGKDLGRGKCSQRRVVRFVIAEYKKNQNLLQNSLFPKNRPF